LSWSSKPRNKRRTAPQGGPEEQERGQNQGEARKLIGQGLNRLPDVYC
jgi:hypothetical protein